MAEEVKLFNTRASLFGWRVIWALKLKGIQYESIEEDLSNKSPLLLQYNPIYKKVPVLLHNGKPVVESLVILQYIEETWKQNPLLPAHPYERAMAYFWAKFGEDKVLPSLWLVFIKQNKDREEAVSDALENLKVLEEELRGKKFFGGENIGFVDLAFGWVANTVSVLEEVTGIKLIEEIKFPLFAAWIKEFLKSPTIRECLPPRVLLISKYGAFLESCHTNKAQNV